MATAPLRNDMAFKFAGGVSLFFASLAFIAHLLISSRLIELSALSSVLNNASIAMIIIASAIGVFLCLDPGRALVALAAIGFFVAVPLSVYNFDLNTLQPFSPLSGGLYYGAATLGIYAAVIKYRKIDQLLVILYWVCLTYSAFYVVTAVLLNSGQLAPLPGSTLIKSEDLSSGRGARVTMLTSHVTFAICVTLAAMREKVKVHHIASLALLVSATWLAQSRFYTALIILIAGSYFVFRSARLLGWVAWVSFLIGTVVSVYVAFSSYNPFLGSSDISAWARSEAIEIVHRMIGDYWVYGAGIASGDLAYYPLTKSKIFYPSDLGMIGQIFSFGVIGLAAYIAQAFAACFSPNFAARLGVEPKYAVGLGLTGIAMSLYSILAPVFAGGSASVFGALYLALLATWRPIRRLATASELGSLPAS